MREVFTALLFLLFRRDVISEPEFDALLRSLQDNSPDALVKTLLIIAGGKYPVQEEDNSHPADDYVYKG